MSVKELQKELGTRHLEPLKTSETLLSAQKTYSVEQIPVVKVQDTDLSKYVTHEEYERLKLLYDDIKEDNDKKKTYIQELASKYQNIIEDLKAQLTQNSSNQHYQENLKLRKVIKKMDEEITILSSKKSEEPNTDELNLKIDELTRKNMQL